MRFHFWQLDHCGGTLTAGKKFLFVGLFVFFLMNCIEKDLYRTKKNTAEPRLFILHTVPPCTECQIKNCFSFSL